MHKSTKSCSIIIEISFYICYIDREEFKFLMLFLYLGNNNIVCSENLGFPPVSVCLFKLPYFLHKYDKYCRNVIEFIAYICYIFYT